jgi:SNF2 family DNA or RNA helicase
MGTKVTAGLKDRKIWITFDFDPRVVEQIKEVPGRRFINADKGGPAWTIPLDLNTARILWRVFKDDLVVLPELQKWANQRVGAERELSRLALVEAAPLEVLPTKLPELALALHVGPKGRGLEKKELEKLAKENPDGSFQSADTRFLARATNPLNGNQPRLGKTLETIGSIFEAGEEEGPHLVLAPLTSLETVWKMELETWQHFPVWVASGNSYQRDLIIEDFLCTEGPGWLVCNHHMAQMNRKKQEDGTIKYWPKYPKLHEVEWNTVILDEVHKAGFRDTNSLMYRGAMAIPALKRMALSGTPIGGKPVNLWHILHWLEPDEFSDLWHWANQWCVIEENDHGKKITIIKPELEEEFYKFHAQYFLRRLREEVADDFPTKQDIPVWVHMEGKQLKQYQEMALAAEVKIEDEELTAFGILAEYTRLKQFSISRCTLEPYHDRKTGERKVKVKQTTESCKLQAVEQLLEERGIFEGVEDEQVVIFSQFSEVVDMVYDWLEEKGVKVLKLTGQTNPHTGERAEVQRSFQAGEAQVLCMTTTAGGVAITLARANTCIFMDETWDPGDQEQASDRLVIANKLGQVSVYTIRTKDTIEAYIQSVLVGKENVNKVILDLRRQGLRATGFKD